MYSIAGAGDFRNLAKIEKLRTINGGKYAKLMEEGYQSLVDLDGVDDKIADVLYDNDITSAAELAGADPAEVVEIVEALDLEAVEAIIETAKLAPEKENREDYVPRQILVKFKEGTEDQARFCRSSLWLGALL